MRRIGLGVWLGLSAGTLLAQEVLAPPVVVASPKPVTARARITGTVLCADTRRPARGAMVMVTPLPALDPKTETQQTVTVRVAMDGTFAAEHLSAGEYTVIALLPGYLSAFDSLMLSEFDGPSSPAKQRAILAKNGTVVLHGAETATRDLVLTRGAAVSGRVVYSDGSPATQVSILMEDVKAKPPASSGEREQVTMGGAFRAMLTHQSAGTDDQGHFRIAGLPPGSYRVAAAQIGGTGAGGDGMGLAMAGIPDAAAMRFYSGDTTRKGAARVYELRSGDEVADILITIPDTLLHQVRGSISAIGGKTITSGTVTLKDSADTGWSLTNDLLQEDTFVFPQVPAGTYTLSITEAKSQSYAEGPEQPPPPTIFADESRTILVKDTDITDANFTLKEAAPADSPRTPPPTASPPP